MMKQLLFPIISLLLLTACATNPVNKSSEFVLMSEEQELSLGQKMAAQIAQQMPLLPENDPLVEYVNKVGQRIATVSDRPELFYRFHVVDDGGINAFALPGGYIYLHRGLLAHFNDEAELAAVLGHEVGHVTARHAVQRYTQSQAYNIGMAITSIFVPIPYGVSSVTSLLAQSIIMGYGREQELQSDELSLSYLSKAGYDTGATTRLLEILERLDAIDKKEKTDAGEKVKIYHGAFATHPETKDRIEKAITKAASAQQDGMNRVGREAMLAALDGYPLKDSAKDGAVVGQRFLHPELGIQLEFPENWIIKNSPTALNARIRKEEAFFTMGIKELRKRETAEEVLKSIFPVRRTETITSGIQNGYPFARALVKTSAPHVKRADIDVTVFLDGPKALIMLLYSERDNIEKYQSQFDQIRNSLRPYDKVEDGDIPKIHIHIWKRGDSWKKLAEKSHQILGPFTADRLAALNGMDLTETPAAGTLIKIVPHEPHGEHKEVKRYR